MPDTTCPEIERLDIVGAPMRPTENFTHTASADDEFTADPLLISDQADWFELLAYGDEEFPDTMQYFYALYRAVRIIAPGGWACNADERRWGVHMVAYKADKEGRVATWEARHELEGPSVKAVRAKFDFLWNNDLLDQFWRGVACGFEFEDEQRAQS